MPGIVNGVFAGRSGISAFGQAIGVVGDNISNSNTTGYKTARAEFEDLISGGSTPGRTIGSGSSISSISSIFEQGTLEATGRPLDIGIDGNGYFVVADGTQRFYTRAGNFRVDSAGFIVTQNNMAVLGFPAGGSGALAPININSVEQSSVATETVSISGNVDAGAAGVELDNIPNTLAATPPTVTYAQLSAMAAYSTVVDVFDSLGASHTITYYFFKDDDNANTYQVRGYVNNEDVDVNPTVTGFPRQISNNGTVPGGSITMQFANGDGLRTNTPAAGLYDLTANIAWSNGASASAINIKFDPFTQYSAAGNILSITQDGKGVGAVTNLNIQDDGTIFALLSNGQSATIGTIGLVNFSNAEGLTRIGKNLLTQSPLSGEPIVGEPTSGTFGAVKSGTIELSTVDIADQFVKIITLQRGFQANARVITTINQLLNEIIQLA